MTQEEAISLREYFEDRLDSRCRELTLMIANERDLREFYEQHHAAEVGVAKEALAVRLEGMNELRSQINGERGDYMKREMYDSASRALELRIDGNFRALLDKSDKTELAGVQSTVNELQRKGSDHAQQALREISGIGTRVGQIERDLAGKTGVRDTELRFAETNSKLKWNTLSLVVSGISILVGISGLVTAILRTR